MPNRVSPRAPLDFAERPPKSARASRGYTLPEMLVVVGILAFLIGMTALVVRGGGNVTKTAWDMAGVIEQARAYAVSQNTYVWVMFNVEDASTDAQKNIAVFALASKDGSTTASTANLSMLGKIETFQNVSLADLSGSVYGNRPTSGVEQISGRRTITTTSFTSAPAKNYSPNLVIRFNPTGAAETPVGAGISTVEMLKWIEVGLQPMRGLSPGGEGGSAVIQIAGLTGQVRVYRP